MGGTGISPRQAGRRQVNGYAVRAEGVRELAAVVQVMLQQVQDHPGVDDRPLLGRLAQRQTEDQPSLMTSGAARRR